MKVGLIGEAVINVQAFIDDRALYCHHLSTGFYLNESSVFKFESEGTNFCRSISSW